VSEYQSDCGITSWYNRLRGCTARRGNARQQPAYFYRLDIDRKPVREMVEGLESCRQVNVAMLAAERHMREGHPTIDQLFAEQQLDFPRDPHNLLGDFWPEEGSLDDSLTAMREWRRHSKTDLST
jgi:hypothetical protein